MYFVKKFEELTNDELYAIFYLRQEVFTIEQQVTCSDITPEDKQALHFFVLEGSEVIGYCRILPLEDCVKLQRFCVAKQSRGSGQGRRLILLVMEHIKHHFPNSMMEISAQIYLRKFYESLNFVTVGDVYDDGGIEHIRMQHTS